jgi:hypothetical protein
MILNRSAILIAATIFAAGSLAAHDAKGPNGGRIQDAGAYHVELVAKGTNVELFVTDSGDRPVAATALTGVAVLIVDGKPQRIPLSAAGANKLSGSSTVPLPANPKGAVQLTTPDGRTAQAKY